MLAEESSISNGSCILQSLNLNRDLQSICMRTYILFILNDSSGTRSHKEDGGKLSIENTYMKMVA